jgi:hypothetical protein
MSGAAGKAYDRRAFEPARWCRCGGWLTRKCLLRGDTDMADGQEPCAEEVSDVLAEAHRLARIVERIPALALLMAMPTLRAPA